MRDYKYGMFVGMAILVQVAVSVATVWVAGHFIAKYW